MAVPRRGKAFDHLVPGLALLLLALASLAQPAAAQDCMRLACGPDDGCAIRPARLTARMPAGFSVTSVRNHTSVASQGDPSTANCTLVKQLPQTLSLDQASLYGSLTIAGRLQATGTLRFEPNDGGELEFRPGPEAFAGTGPFFRANFQHIKLDAVQPPLAITPPRPLAKADCWQAHATADLSDFTLVIGDTSAAGTYPRSARISAVRGFRRCTWGGP